jgi:hypothetical protein
LPLLWGRLLRRGLAARRAQARLVSFKQLQLLPHVVVHAAEQVHLDPPGQTPFSAY